MSTFKSIFKITNGILDIASLGIHSGMLINGLGSAFNSFKPLKEFATGQVAILKEQSFLQNGYGKKSVDFASNLHYKNFEFNENDKLFSAEGFVKSGMLGLTELHITGTHLALAYPIAKLLDSDGNLSNSSEFITAFGIIAALDIAHWATSGEESAPEHY